MLEMKDKKSRPVSVNMDDDLIDRLDQVAQAQDRSRSYLVCWCVRQALTAGVQQQEDVGDPVEHGKEAQVEL